MCVLKRLARRATASQQWCCLCAGTGSGSGGAGSPAMDPPSPSGEWMLSPRAIADLAQQFFGRSLPDGHSTTWFTQAYDRARAMVQATAATASQLLLGAAPVSDEFVQQCTKDDVALECLPEAPSGMVVPPSAAALAGSVGSVLGMFMASPAQPVTMGLPGATVMTTRAAISRARLPPQHG
ncbi:unnamed protein product, partial [Symbiodinium sp. KB8]